MSVIFSLIVLYGWFLNVYYFFKPSPKYKMNPFVHIVGIIMPFIGALVGFGMLIANSGKIKIVK